MARLGLILLLLLSACVPASLVGVNVPGGVRYELAAGRYAVASSSPITRWEPASACVRLESSAPQQTLTCSGPTTLIVITDGVVRVRPLP